MGRRTDKFPVPDHQRRPVAFSCASHTLTTLWIPLSSCGAFGLVISADTFALVSVPVLISWTVMFLDATALTSIRVPDHVLWAVDDLLAHTSAEVLVPNLVGLAFLLFADTFTIF